MDVIDEGGYGCVIRPPLNCKNAPPTNKSMISKIQRAKHADYEMQQIKQIKKLCKNKIPNCQDYVATEVHICNPILPKNINTKTKCSLLEEGLTVSSYLSNRKSMRSNKHKNKTKKTKLKIINLPFLGTNLHRYLLHNADFKNPHTFVEVNNAIIQLYQHFIRLLNQNNFYHNDIKALNVMVDKHGTYRLIDWGISNKFIFSHRFVFNKPYNYLLLSSYFLDKIEDMNKQGPLHSISVKQLILRYLDLIKIKQDSNYIYVKEILEYMFPDRVGNKDEINPVLLDCLVHYAMRYKSKQHAVDIYMHNLDITGVALIYPDILCAISIQRHLQMTLFDGIVAFFTKYILHAYDKINPEEFIQDLNKLNLLVV